MMQLVITAELLFGMIDGFGPCTRQSLSFRLVCSRVFSIRVYRVFTIGQNLPVHLIIRDMFQQRLSYSSAWFILRSFDRTSFHYSTIATRYLDSSGSPKWIHFRRMTSQLLLSPVVR
jgi:hypothetical protein